MFVKFNFVFDVVVLQVECYGPGLEKTGLITNSPAKFTVDTRKSGDLSVPEVSVMDANYKPVDMEVNSIDPGLFNYAYYPKEGLKHTVQINQAGVATKNSPYRVYVSNPTDPCKVQVFGPGVDAPVKCFTPTHFNVDARDAGPGTFHTIPIHVTLTWNH